MDLPSPGHPAARRRVLGDATLRANEGANPQRHRGEKASLESIGTSSPKPLPHNESLVPNGTLAIRHQPQSSPENKRLSAVKDDARPRNIKRDSEISTTSTNFSATGRRRKTHIGLWQLGKTIGRGGCSRVRIVRHSVTGEYGAAKIISKATAENVRALSLANLIKSAQEEPSMFPGGQVIPFGLEREIVIMKLLDHPNIVRLHDVWENRNELYLIMEYVQGGELFSYIGEHGRLQEIEVVHLFRQIIASLLYCHRLNIHHRDLKPENILLDRETLQIKLVDFGMAALQPVGKMLTTPCGSPHYAAPEVIQTQEYDGGKADIWSCGVILFVMLTGSPPFNYSGDDSQLKYLFRNIARANYVMPEDLSREAKNLIRKILVPDPRRRISIEAIWDHPFLHKYDVELQFHGDNASMQHWVGPHPAITEWTPLDRSTLDREILRNLRTLWHSEKEEVLVQRLISREPNQEKYFYSALKKHRDETLENYSPNPHVVGYSHSDHHHYAKINPTSADILQLPSNRHKRTQSGYSILNDEHLYSKHSFYDPPSSDASYDPFRASREPIIPGQSTIHQNITVYRGSDSGSRKLRPVTALGHRTGSSLRIQALRNSKAQSSGIISRGSSKRSNPSQRSSNMKRRSMSRSSIASSHWASSPPVVIRSSIMAKRGVSFSHLQRGSTASTVATETVNVQRTPDQRRAFNQTQDAASSTTSSPRPSGQTISIACPVLKTAASSAAPRLRIRKPDSPSKYIQSEARKVSTELEKVMEEAFNRSSVSSSVRTTVTETNKEMSEYDTPPTSFSNRDSGGSMIATPNQRGILQNRPLPPIPIETPNTFLHRKLAETRAEIARKLDEDGDSTEHFNEVLEHLDRLMQPANGGTKRASSAPTKSPEPTRLLPVISEEMKLDGEDRYLSYSPNYRVVTDPVRPNLQGRRGITEHNTIRLVDQSPTPLPIAPLNIRKQSGASTLSHTERGNQCSTDPLQGLAPQPTVKSYQGVRNNLAARANESGLANTAPLLPPEKEFSIKKKRSLWFRRTPEEKERQQESQPKPAEQQNIHEVWQGLDNPPATTGTTPDMVKETTKQSETSTSTEFPMRNRTTAVPKAEGGLKGFLGLFGKKVREDKGKKPMEVGSANLSSSSILSGFDLDLDPEAENSSSIRPPEIQTNWLSRFLHIKPASKVLCFQLRRGRVRGDLVRLLRRWQRFGVRDVTYDRTTNVINARVDKNNHLKIKPVSLVIELFVVLEHGRNANLTLVRFTQTRGAASSFRRVVDVVEDVCRSSSMLVEDEEKRAAMCEILE
ncbi:Pkinase-domain-containing protein [Lojkania enalia]|uniref:non-specific serine/threonine protein kinase n=1 Tax=Lojkania enalia TaxID=147567 RepID=A0A9P4N5L1_9PLEO|nr:Pkinase-domain-containing protein [Didymosphaeria enalia]